MRTGWMRRIGEATLAIALLGLVAPPAASAEEADSDPRWLAWVGCWLPDSGDDHVLCVRPLEGDDAVVMVTYADGQVVSEETVRANGQQRPVRREGCNGWESASFSPDGKRIYLRSEFACEGDVRRSSSGLISMASPMMWLDVQSVGAEGHNAVRVIRYRLASPELLEQEGVEPVVQDNAMAVDAARRAASAPLTVDAVIDASAQLAPETVEAWIVERGDRFAMNADALIRMDEAGVPASVIDLAVAVSHPERFAIDNQARTGEYVSAESEEYRRPDHYVYAYPGYYDSFYWDPFRYSRYGRYYSPWGYGGRWYPGYTPVVVIVEPDDDDMSGPPGRVVRGRGYTRGGRTVSEPSGSGTYRSPGRSSGTPTVSRPARGTSSGAAGTSTTRRAKPRTGGTTSGTGTGGL